MTHLDVIQVVLMGSGVSECHVISIQHHSETVGLQEGHIAMLGSSLCLGTRVWLRHTGKSDLMSLFALKSLQEWL